MSERDEDGAEAEDTAGAEEETTSEDSGSEGETTSEDSDTEDSDSEASEPSAASTAEDEPAEDEPRDADSRSEEASTSERAPTRKKRRKKGKKKKPKKAAVEAPEPEAEGVEDVAAAGASAEPDVADDDSEADDRSAEDVSASTADSSPADSSTVESSPADSSTADSSTADSSTADSSPAASNTAASSPAMGGWVGGGGASAMKPRRTPIAWLRASLLTLTGLGGTFLLMANVDQVPHGPLFGMLTVALGVAGVLDLLGLWEGQEGDGARPIRETALFALEGEPFFLSPVVTVPLGLGVFVIAALAGGFQGLPIAIALGLLCLLPSAFRRPGLMLFVVASGLLLPFLGAYGLWDPWETHYGEVAREMLARDDWISLWWAQEDFFWSKPILIFWMEALGMGALGVNFAPDGNPAHPEWAIRLPHFLLTLGALFSVYTLVSKVWSKRAGLVTGVVLVTTPHFFLLSHQAITDMPFVTNMTMAICMFGLAVSTKPDAVFRSLSIGRLRVSARHLVLGTVSAVVLPQVLYLLSRNVTFMHAFPPFGWHGDVFLHGSAGNHGVPGNSAVHNLEPVYDSFLWQPATQGLFWLLAFLLVLVLFGRERRSQPLYMLAFYFFCGMAFMAKGIPGFALPGLVALFYLLGTKRWDLLLEGRLKVGAGILTVLTVGLPWYAAMFIRHGTAFTDRLLIHDHLNRLTAGVHGDNGSIEYFIEQMGYGLFPWVALIPLALAAWLAPLAATRETEATLSRTRVDRRRTLMLFALWLASAFTLFSAMTTKFHHYIFPAVVPTAVLVGLAAHRVLAPERSGGFSWLSVGRTALAVLAPIPAVLGVAGLFGDVRGVIPEPPEGATDAQREALTSWVENHPWSMGACVALIALGAAMLAGAWWLSRDREAAPRSVWARGAIGTGLLAGPALLALVGRDLSWITDARPQGNERLIQLFVYNYGRAWPTELDYRPILTGFAIVLTLLVLFAAAKPIRDVAMRAFLGAAVLFCAWTLDVYLIDLSPHWTQRELIHRYYEERASADEPILAYQMNWKGENFYTGNRVHVFVQLDNRALRTWASEHAGTTAYVLTERSRLGGLRGALQGAEITEVTDDRFCNKFMLVRAQLGPRTPAPSPGSRE